MARGDVGRCDSPLKWSPPPGHRLSRSRLTGILYLAVWGFALALAFLTADLRGVRWGEAAPRAPRTPPKPAPSSPAVPAPTKVRVGVWLLRVGDVNIATETYDMDLYLIFDCDRPCRPNNFEIMNGRPVTQELQDDLPAHKVFRIRGALRKALDLRGYPFDRHPVSITIEDSLLASDKLVYVSNPQTSGIDPGFNIPGWVFSHEWQAGVETHYYPAFRKAYSRYTFSTTIARPALAALFKVMLPAMFLVGVGFLALLLGPDRVMQRLTVSTSALLGAVLFHLNLNSSIPPIGYLTFADRFMVVNYVALTLSVASTVVLLYLIDKHRTEQANRVHLLFGVALPALWIVLQVVDLLVF
jgi:hypothetical protein